MHFRDVGAAAKDDRAAAETRPGQARADGAGVHRGIHQAVQRRATDLQAIAQAGVGFQQQAAEAIGVIRSHRLYGVAHAEGLGDDVQEWRRQMLRRREGAKFLLGPALDRFAIRCEARLAQRVGARVRTAL